MRPMKLGINGWRLQTRTGVARVLINVIKHWTRDFVGDRFQAITLYSPTRLSGELPIPDLVKQRFVGPTHGRLCLSKKKALGYSSCDTTVLLTSPANPWR
jgi:hypothetical protein